MVDVIFVDVSVPQWHETSNFKLIVMLTLAGHQTQKRFNQE